MLIELLIVVRLKMEYDNFDGVLLFIFSRLIDYYDYDFDRKFELILFERIFVFKRRKG